MHIHCEKWFASTVVDHARRWKHYARLFKVAQPTTLADLVGEDGQKTAYLHYREGYAETLTIETRNDELYMINGEAVAFARRCKRRWSHNPTTRYEDANEFSI